jgi:GNAT superfamily N-acetyltransferase
MNRYTSRLADFGHKPIRTWQDFLRRTDSAVLGLYLNGQVVGTGELLRASNSRRFVHTDGMCLRQRYRRKGHGIHLYLAIIAAARRIGARRIYSSYSLNNLSRRMWERKLRSYFNVKRQGGCKSCSRGTRFYIDLV